LSTPPLKSNTGTATGTYRLFADIAKANDRDFVICAVNTKKERRKLARFYTNANMAFILKNMNFVRTLIILLLAISLCDANMRFVKTRFTQNKIVKTSHTTLQNISSIWCVYICYKRQLTGGCTLAGYNKVTQTCCLSSDDPKNVLDTTDEMSGVFFYKPEPTGIVNSFDTYTRVIHKVSGLGLYITLTLTFLIFT